MLNNQLLRERDSINTQIANLKNHLKQLPEGKLLCSKNENRTKWYLSNGRHPIYIPKKDREYAEKLAARKYYEICLTEAEAQLRILEKLIALQPSQNQSDQLLDSPMYQELLSSYFQSHNGNNSTWIQAEYVHNTSYPENLVHPTYAGDFVRSKSEVIIANTLYLHKIPYRYECELKLGNVNCFPDFTILHPKTGQLYYWEHFGLMSNESYCDATFTKMKLYGNYNIIPSLNLITTYETNTCPIKSTKIEAIVEEYFGLLIS